MKRIKFSGELINCQDNISSILDIGCRECGLKKFISPEIEYFGSDLYQNKYDSVQFVGDIMNIDFHETFDLVVALDILEHVDQPSVLFDKLMSLANTTVIVSLPNCYDLKSRVKFLIKGHLGGKYEFKSEIIEDRHRWIMSRIEINQFYADKAKKHNTSDLQIKDMKYGDLNGKVISKLRSLSRVLPANLCSETVFGIFTK